MSDEIWRRDEPDSPCQRICMIHPEAGLCIGCYRSRAEIAGWSAMSAETRLALKAELPGRASRLTRRSGGRAGRRRDPA